MAFPERVSASTGKNSGGASYTISLPAGIQAGDLLVVFSLSVGATSSSTAWGSKGWWLLYGAATNTRYFSLAARIYNPSDPSSVYDIPFAAGAYTKYVALAIRNHGVVDGSEIIVGTPWTRFDHGGSQGRIYMDPVETPGEEYLALGFTGEASNAVGGWSPFSGGFTFWTEIKEGGVANTDLEWITSWYREIPNPGSTQAQEITYSTTSSNGVGMQLAIPPAVSEIIETGRIGMHGVTSPSPDSISFGFDKLGGNKVEIALIRSTDFEEVGRQIVSSDATTGWGNITFTGLVPNTIHWVWVFVDDVMQTDAFATIKTMPVGPSTFVFVAGSCQFTGSNHPIFRKMKQDQPLFLAHMGDLHYADATTEAAWRAGHEASYSSYFFKELAQNTIINWAPDNHDRIITNPTGAGTGLNLGETDPKTAEEWKLFAGASGWASPDTLGRTWVAGRVRFIQTDAWSARDDADGDPSPRTFLGAAQKAWFKNVLATAQEPLIIWFSQWTVTNNGNGRWNSFPEETSELEAFINARPELKRRMIMIGGDSHSLNADDGTRAPGNHRFAGIPSLNVSGFNRSNEGNDGQTFWTIANASIRPAGALEADWGAYSRVTIVDDGMHIRFLWEAIRVDSAGDTDRIAFYTRSYGSPYDHVYLGDIPASSVNLGNKTLWQEPYHGATI